jgi:hypothetical protein
MACLDYIRCLPTLNKSPIDPESRHATFYICGASLDTDRPYIIHCGELLAGFVARFNILSNDEAILGFSAALGAWLMLQWGSCLVSRSSLKLWCSEANIRCFPGHREESAEASCREHGHVCSSFWYLFPLCFHPLSFGFTCFVNSP